MWATTLYRRSSSFILTSLTRERGLHVSAVIGAGQQWRLGLGKSRSGTEYGPLTDIPDWRFADGRLAPPTRAHVRRSQRQKKIKQRIQTLISEMEQAEEEEAS